MLDIDEHNALISEAERLGFDDAKTNRLMVWALTARMTSVAIELLGVGGIRIIDEHEEGEFLFDFTRETNEPRQGNPERQGTPEAVPPREGD